MCGDGCKKSRSQDLSNFQKYFRALHCPVRWSIIRLIGNGAKSTNEIFEGLKKVGEGLSRTGLYYHLSELEDNGIVEVAEYRELGGGAPEKVWKLKTKEIRIDLLKDLPRVAGHDR